MYLELTEVISNSSLTHLWLAFHKRSSGKQCRPKSDEEISRVRSGPKAVVLMLSIVAWLCGWLLRDILPFEEVVGAYCFGLSVRPCVHASVRQEPCMLGFWNFIYGFLMEKYLTHVFFSLSELSPFLELCPFEKIRPKSDACHILWTVHARVL